MNNARGTAGSCGLFWNKWHPRPPHVSWWALIGALPVIIGALIAVSPQQASAVPAAIPNPNPVLGDDVYLYHPILKSVEQKPPLATVIRFRVEEYTNYQPQAFHLTIHLYRWRSAAQLKRPKGAWVEIHPTVRYGLASLEPVGQHDYLTPPADWTCETGRLFVELHAGGIMHTGTPRSVTLYFPWAGYNRLHLSRGNPLRRPKLKQAWLTKCQGKGDTLIG